MISSFAEKESSPLTFLILTDFYLFFFFNEVLWVGP